MRKACAVLLALVLALLPAGCGGAPLSMVSGGNNMTVNAFNAPDGATLEGTPISLGKDKTFALEAALEKGELRIELIAATVRRHSDEPDDVSLGDVIVWAAVAGEDRVEFSSPGEGDYVIRVTAVGKTKGQGKISIR